MFSRRTHLGSAAAIDPDLSEWDYGDYEGVRSVDIRKARPDWNIFQDGCPGGESPADVSERADRLIVAKLDRLARDVVVAVQIDRAATLRGWAIVFGDLDIDTGTAAGKLQLSMFASFAQFERDRISERTKEALAVKRAQGVKLGRPAVLSPAVVKRIRKEHKAGRSLRAIAAGLTADAVPTARGGAIWQVSTIQKVLSRGVK